MRRLGVLAAPIASLTILIACGGSPATTTSLVAPATNATSGTTSTPNTGSPGASSTTGSTGSGTTTTTSSVLPVPPSTATVFDSIQNTTNAWSDCSDCAGGAVTSSYSTTPFLATPSLSGSSRQFFIAGPAWSDALWIHKFGPQNSAVHFLWDFYVYFDAASAAAVWSAEYDLWQSIGGQKHMMGTQCVFGTNEWDVWDSAHSKWINTGVPCPRFSGGAWHHIQWDTERLSATQYRFNTLFVDDQAIPINRVFDTEPTNWDDDAGVQWQLDQNAAGTPVTEWIDRVRLTIW